MVFETRWAMSYLRGPLTRAQIKTLMDPRRGDRGAAPAAGKPAKTTAAARGGDRPVLPPEVAQLFVPVRGKAEAASTGRAPSEWSRCTFPTPRPEWLSRRCCRSWRRSATRSTGRPRRSRSSPWRTSSLRPRAAPRSSRSRLRPSTRSASRRGARTWRRGSIARKRSSSGRAPSAGEVSKPGESEADFRGRLQQGAREKRDAAADKLREKYEGKLATLQDRLRRAEQAVGREKQESVQAGVQTAISVGATVLGALFGRKKLSASTIGRATTAARGAGRTVKTAGDVGRAEESAEAIRQQLKDLDAELQSELAVRISAQTDPVTEKLETVTLRPKKSDVSVRRVALVWVP